MRIVVSANGADLEAPPSPQFGRCSIYLFVNTDTLHFEAKENPAANASAGAGIHAAQFVVEQGVQAVVTGSVGPHSFHVFQAAQVPVYLYTGGVETVREAVEAFREGRLYLAGDARSADRFVPDNSTGQRNQREGDDAQYPSAGVIRDDPSREQQIAALESMASDLRRQLAEMKAQLKELEAR